MRKPFISLDKFVRFLQELNLVRFCKNWTMSKKSRTSRLPTRERGGTDSMVFLHLGQNQYVKKKNEWNRRLWDQKLYFFSELILNGPPPPGLSSKCSDCCFKGHAKKSSFFILEKVSSSKSINTVIIKNDREVFHKKFNEYFCV